MIWTPRHPWTGDALDSVDCLVTSEPFDVIANADGSRIPVVTISDFRLVPVSELSPIKPRKSNMKDRF